MGGGKHNNRYKIEKAAHFCAAKGLAVGFFLSIGVSFLGGHDDHFVFGHVQN